MNPREKYIILGSMSLGVMYVSPPSFPSQLNTNILSAGAFGIVRSTQIPSLLSPDYLRKYPRTSPQPTHQLTHRR